MSLLEIRGLQKSFGTLKVTDDLNLSIEPGEFHAIIGPNGAGKSTLIAQIFGQTAPDAGTIFLAGSDISGLPVHRRAQLGLARSFQITSILPGFTVLENVALAVQRWQGSSFRFFATAAKDRFRTTAAVEMLGRVGLAARRADLARSLSHGERRQLELAMALAGNPKLLLLDEPLAGTSGAESERLVALISDLKRDVTLVLVEHDMQAVFALADRISVLVQGRIIRTGTPDEVRDDPSVRAAYLGQGAGEADHVAS